MIELGISYQTKIIESITTDTIHNEEDIFVKPQNGVLDLPNFEETMLAFNESRQDRILD